MDEGRYMEMQESEQQTYASLRAGVAAAVMMVVACFCIAAALLDHSRSAEASENQVNAKAETAADNR
ncbi:MAG: hypothetical protein R3E18_03525 [Sphingomonadaceae bacterium]|nr:hypothetical protein [Sphingomonadaceae bacterium]